MVTIFVLKMIILISRKLCFQGNNSIYTESWRILVENAKLRSLRIFLPYPVELV